MKKLISAISLIALFCIDHAEAQLPNIDRTCTTCSRRYLDSLNVYNRRPIRMNQAGFRPQDYKYAYVADPVEKTFKVIDANSGKEVPGGGNLTLIKKGATKPNIWINGSFNSLESIYEFGRQDSISTQKEDLYRADFTTLSTTGEYFLVVGKDTSATFHVHPSIYNAILENSLQFFGIQRCGNTDSHFHKPCHLQDGSKIGHDLTGGWHDCGDHFKVSETLGYTAYVLSMVYLTYPNKAEDRYGHSYADTVFTDGIPDILYEAKIGADFILKLYKASKAEGLIAKHDMFHSVGVDEKDHQFWDLPERQDAQPESKGGPDRVVLTGIGANTSGMFVAALANVATGYRVYDAAYADTLLEAAKDIYKNVMMPLFDYGSGNESGKTTDFPGFYTGGGPRYDDGAAAALALWYATKDTTYRYDLYKNTNIFNNPTNYQFNLDYFRAGFLGNESGFSPGGWATDYQNIHTYVLFAFQNLILKDPAIAAEYGLTEIERDSLSMRTMATFRKILNDATNQGDSTVLVNPGVGTGDPHEGPTDLKVITPYNLVWTSFDWGVIRYNLGTAVSIFLMYELTKDERYLRVALDNMYYALGANPWDISLLMGAGDKNPQHPHNRSANPDGYNAGGMPYQYRCPKGALMGGRDPEKTLIEDWSKYTSTETCIDFSAQFLFPAQSLAETLPPDNEGPIFSNIVGTPISNTEAIISWDANEVALVTVFYDVTTNANTAKSVQQEKASKGGSVTLTGLTPGQTYYFFLEGMDTKRNLTTDDNHGYWYKFTMTPIGTQIKGVTICQVDHRSAKIYWWSTDRLNGIVNFGKAKGTYTQSTAASGGAVLFHEAILTGLEAGTEYFFTVSSGTTTSDEYSFKTESFAAYADLDIYIKPSAYQNTSKCSGNNWKNCGDFIVEIDNNDTTDFQDFELRLYLGADASLETPVSYIGQVFGGTGLVVPRVDPSKPLVTFGPQTQDKAGQYYLPITVNDKLYVSGRIIFQIKWLNATYASFNDGWSLIAHTGDDAQEQFEGIDLTQAPYYTGSETAQLETNSHGEKVIAMVRDPYVPVYYHGKHIYGYAPDDTPETGPQVNRNVEINFTSPFVTPYYSVEKEDTLTTYSATSKVTPTGLLDAVEMNSNPYPFEYVNTKRTDAITFGKQDTVLAYGNNYIEWVSWHNRNANQKSENKYDCACAYVRSNVEIDSITIPPEKRYLVFDKIEIEGYKDKFIEVKISLLDSNLELIKDEKNLNVDLVTNDPNVLFYTDPTATIPVTSVTLYNGVTTIYVSSKVAVQTTISATHISNKEFAYTPATAELNILELPPWPIIDVAKIVDLDCDHIPDAMDIKLSSEYTENQKFSSITFTYGATTITSSNVKSLNGKSLIVSIDVPKEIVTNASGKITLTSDIQGQVKTVDDSYSDGIPPALLSATVLERQDTAKADHLYLQFSEPISAPGTNFPLVLYGTDKTTKATTPTVLSAKLYNEEKNIWDFEIAFDAAKNSLVNAGMWGQLDPAGSITDLNGNGVAGLCTPEKVEILLKILPIPMNYAVIMDKKRNGYANYVEITFAKPLDEKHTPEKLEIIFGIAKPETLTVEKSKYVINGEVLSIDLSDKPFQYGNTAGNYEGTFPGGKFVSHAGYVTQFLGTGAATETNSVLAEDKVGPVYVSAIINQTTITDILSITASEPLAIADSSQQFYRHMRANKQSNAFSSGFTSWSYSKNNSGLTLLYMGDLAGSVMEGDFIRMGSMMTSAFKDANGNYPEFDVQWVPVDGNGTPKIKFDVNLRKLVYETDLGNQTKVNAKETMRLFIRNTATNKYDLIQDGMVTMTGIDSTDIGGAIFDIKLTVPRGASVGEECAWEKLNVKFNIPIYSNLGSFVNRFNKSFDVNPKQYLSPSNIVEFAIEWANKAPSGIRTQEDRAVGTGAFIYKAEISAKFSPNMNNPEVKNDPKIANNFSTKQTFEQTKTFGIKSSK